MKTILLFSTLILSALFSAAQTPVKIVGTEMVSMQHDTTANAIKTTYTFKLDDGTILPVYQTTKGSYFIIRTSKKTNKPYRQYLKIS